MSFLGYDGPLAQGIRYLCRLIVLNLCFLVCCLPIVTIGAAVTALNAAFLNRSVDSGAARRFFRDFASNFRQATLIWLLVLAVGALLGLDYYYLFSYRVAGGTLILIMTILFTVMYLSVSFFTFALQAHYGNKIRFTIRNGLILGTTGVFSGILMIAVTFYPVAIFFLDLELFIYSFAIWLLIGAALSAQLNAKLAQRVFAAFQSKS